MKILITEEQYNTTQTKLKNMVKKLGLEPTAKAVGGFKNLVKILGIEAPRDFLNLYNDLDVVQSEEQPDWTLFRYKKHDNLMAYDRKIEYVYINYYEIWSVLEGYFYLNRIEILKLTKEWLAEVYNLRGVTTGLSGTATTLSLS